MSLGSASIPVSTMSSRTRLPGGLPREQLVQQQFWLFGADIRRPEGNLLLELGFERFRAGQASQGSSCYVLRGTEMTIHLWGFGCCLTTAAMHRVYLSRHRAAAYRISDCVVLEELHAVPELHGLCRGRPAADPLDQAALFRWFADYERRIRASVGLSAREATLDLYGARKLASAAVIPDMWDALATELA